MDGNQPRELKRDVFGHVELDVIGGVECVRRVVAQRTQIPGARSVARWLLARECRALDALAGLAGVPQRVREPGPQDGRESVLRTFVCGAPLHRCTQLPLDFFDNLELLVGQLHARGVAHNDLHKEQNIVVGSDGWPHVIDFQLASVHEQRSRTLATRARDDLRHVAKHRRRYLRYARVEDERFAPAFDLRSAPPRPPQRTGVALAWRRTGKPLYNWITRDCLGRRDGEERRETVGPWPVWSAPRGPRGDWRA